MILQASQDQVQKIISQKLIDKLHLAYFAVDEEMRVCDVSPNLTSYGFPELNAGDPVDDQIDFMIGMDAHTQLDLPVVSSPSGLPICVNLVPSGHQLTVLISDASDATEQRRLLQQAANENELLVEKQKTLMAKLETASLQLEDKNRLLEEASRLQTSFLSGVSHEFRTPLTSIIGYTNLVKSNLKKIKGNPSSQTGHLESFNNSTDYLGAVQRSSKHLMSLIENLLDHGKLDSDEIVIRPKPTLLSELFKDVELVLKPLSETKGIGLVVDLNANGSDQVVLDDSRLRQCLINLVGNAIKFTDEGQVTLQARLENENLEVTITDTGIGISDEELQKIRLPFYQAPDTGKVGTGLGLTITERIIEMMGGSLDIESKLGAGTSVHFSLLAPTLVKEASLASATSLIDSRFKLKVLLAEDDRDIADLVIMMLSEENVDVTHVANGALAVEAIQNNHFDMVLMDIHMPLMTGYEAVAELNKLGSRTPIVVMSASAVEDDQRKAVELGCAAYLVKPVDVQEIISMAHTLLK